MSSKLKKKKLSSLSTNKSEPVVPDPEALRAFAMGKFDSLTIF